MLLFERVKNMLIKNDDVAEKEVVMSTEVAPTPVVDVVTVSESWVDKVMNFLGFGGEAEVEMKPEIETKVQAKKK